MQSWYSLMATMLDLTHWCGSVSPKWIVPLDPVGSLQGRCSGFAIRRHILHTPCMLSCFILACGLALRMRHRVLDNCVTHIDSEG